MLFPMREVKRLEWIDYTKGFSIILVVIGHTMGGIRNANLPYPEAYHIATVAIYTFHMPLFLFISGYLSKNMIYQTMRYFVKSIVVSIVIPYAIWSILFILVNAASMAATHPLKIVDVKGIALPQGVVSVYWFFYCMFLVKVAYFSIARMRSALVIPIAVCVLVMYFFYFFVRQFSQEITVGEFAEGFGQKMLMGGAFFGLGSHSGVEDELLNCNRVTSPLRNLVRRLDRRDDRSLAAAKPSCPGSTRSLSRRRVLCLACL